MKQFDRFVKAGSGLFIERFGPVDGEARIPAHLQFDNALIHHGFSKSVVTG